MDKATMMTEQTATTHATDPGRYTLFWVFIPLYLVANVYLLWAYTMFFLRQYFVIPLLFYYMHNLIAPSVAHVAMNVLGKSFG